MLNRHSKALNIEDTIPDDWRKSVIVSMSKKDNSTALNNQRGIANTCSSAKLFNKVLLSRLKPIIDPQLCQCQSSFCAGRSTTEQVMALKCAIDTCRVTNMTASLVFVDFRKAFDMKWWHSGQYFGLPITKSVAQFPLRTLIYALSSSYMEI